MRRKPIQRQCVAASLLALVVGLIALAPMPAFACGGIFDVVCNLNNGGMSPQNIGRQTQETAQNAANAVAQAGQNVANAVNELQASVLTGPTLEQAINASRDTAMNSAMPIPADMRQQLTGYASENSMNRARYKIGDNGFLNLARLLEQGGFAAAVTLNDVIVFQGPSEAADPSIWAHELAHVDQYSEWGVHSFAVQYTRNAQGVENPAYAKGDNFWGWRQQQQLNQVSAPMMVQPGPMVPPFTMPPQNLGAFCYTAAGRFGPGPIQPMGAPCFVSLPQGNFPGQVGP